MKGAQRRVAGLEKQMEAALPNWSLAPVVKALMAMRGIGLITAMTVLAELGDISRFDSPRQLMAYLGLVPSEHSSGGSRRQGALGPATAMSDACWWRPPGATASRRARRASFSSVPSVPRRRSRPLPVRVLSSAGGHGQDQAASRCGRGARADWLPMGHRLRAHGQTARQPGHDMTLASQCLRVRECRAGGRSPGAPMGPRSPG